MSNKETNQQRGAFTGKLGYVLSAAGASVGLGNIWRFPYLAAKYGGGIFLLVYLILAVTFGYTMIMSETAIGRMTGKSPISAFKSFGKGPEKAIGGWFNAIIPLLIVPYYSVIGGWVFKYFWGFLVGDVHEMAQSEYFGNFIADPGESTLWFILFSAVTLIVILMGVENGIEGVSRKVMPLLLILAVIVSGYNITRPGAMAGVKYLLVPDFSNFSLMTVVAALGQMFYSLSIAMGILITFGSYMKRDVDMESSTRQVEIVDTLVAFLAGLMIIPAVFAFSGGDTDAVLQSGPSLMFVTLPKVFESMAGGRIIGFMFFLLVLFAAGTSALALAETCVATLTDELKCSRIMAVGIMGAIEIGLGLLSVFGFNILSNVKLIGMDFLDFFDFLTNSVMMPIAAIFTCLLILRTIGLPKIEEEITYNGTSRFIRRPIYRFVLKYLAILFLLVILISSVLNVFGLISI